MDGFLPSICSNDFILQKKILGAVLEHLNESLESRDLELAEKI